MQDDRSKRCTRCGETKPLTQFRRRNTEGSIGFQSACKACNNAYKRSPEKQAEHERQAREWYWANKARRQQYLRDNPDQYRRHRLERRARIQDALIEHVEPLVVLERHDGVCGICGRDVDPFDFHVDHIVPLSKGGEHSYNNTQPAHPSCNIRKGAKVP